MENSDWVNLGVVVLIIVIAVKLVSYLVRRFTLVRKYGREIGLKVLAGKVWQGMTEEQLRDGWGKPVDIDRVLYKTKSKETWKYNQTGKNRFKDRIYLEDKVVVGWKD